jgi:hypothetical protein
MQKSPRSFRSCSYSRYAPETCSSTAMLKQALDRTTSRGSKARVRPIHKGVNPAIEVERAASARAL